MRKKTKKIVQDLLSDDESLARVGAINAIRLSPKKISTELIVALLNAVGEYEEFIDLLLPLLHALSYVTIKNPDKMITTLRKKTIWENSYVREIAVNLLGWTGRPQATEILWDWYSTEKITLVRSVIASSLGDLGSKKCVSFLLRILEQDKEEDSVKGSAIESLGRLGVHATEAVPILTEIIEKKPYSDYAWIAVEALGRIGDSRAIPFLNRALCFEDKDLSECSAIALGEIGGEQAEEALSIRLKSAHGILSEYIKDALEIIRKREE